MKKIGEIVLLQVQVESIKTGTKPNQRYVPDPHLTSIPRLRINSDGVEGITAGGDVLHDVHNRTHPRTKFTGTNGVSLGFTGHYDRMRDRFGDHMVDGIAGEGIIVRSDTQLPLEALAGGILIRSHDREVTLHDWQVLNPCAPFTRFCLQFPEGEKPNREFTQALTFLENGMRGFKMVYPEGADIAEIHLGDEVFAFN